MYVTNTRFISILSTVEGALLVLGTISIVISLVSEPYALVHPWVFGACLFAVLSTSVVLGRDWQKVRLLHKISTGLYRLESLATDESIEVSDANLTVKAVRTFHEDGLVRLEREVTVLLWADAKTTRLQGLGFDFERAFIVRSDSITRTTFETAHISYGELLYLQRRLEQAIRLVETSAI